MPETSLIEVKTTTFGLEVNQADLVTVAVSKAEGLMLQRVDEATKAVRAVEAQLKKDEAALKAAVEAQAQAHFKDAAAAFTAAGKLIEREVRADISASRTNDGKVVAGLGVGKSGYGYGMEYKDTLEPSPEVKAAADALAATTELLNKHRGEIVEWRRKLASIPTLERRYKAQLIEGQLSKTDAGRELLAALGANPEKDILALPGA